MTTTKIGDNLPLQERFLESPELAEARRRNVQLNALSKKVKEAASPAFLLLFMQETVLLLDAEALRNQCKLEEDLKQELLSLLEEQGQAQQKLGEALAKEQRIKGFQSGLTLLTTSVGVIMGATLAGPTGLFVAGGALAQGLTQVASATDFFSTCGNRLGKTREEKERIGSQLQSLVSALATCWNVGTLFVGGGSLLKEGVERAISSSIGGASLLGSLLQNGLMIRQARISGNRGAVEATLKEYEGKLGVLKLQSKEAEVSYISSLEKQTDRFERLVDFLRQEQETAISIQEMRNER